MSYLLPHLRTGWSVDQAIINEEERVVCLRFGHDHDVTCMQMDEVLAGIAEDVKNFCAIYVVDVSEVNTAVHSADKQHRVHPGYYYEYEYTTAVEVLVLVYKHGCSCGATLSTM